MKEARNKRYKALIRYDKLIINNETYRTKDLEKDEEHENRETSDKSRQKRTVNERSPESDKFQENKKKLTELSISDKKKELLEEFEKTDLDILGITKTKKKGKRELELQSGHILIYSGVQHTSRAREGVGCIIKEEKAKYINK
ncbi:hypothetical protein RN001_016052 [Aquatica leii]|uniref:Uncharacterized protein n=1 Tax=Aquatica leii TaxID=1421715 RepID=A0AAN7NZT8_9COLE|nr:hypothetical protein RN001_016052 [Aquatica leii]